MTKLRLIGGAVYDPIHDIDGQVREIWIDNGKIVSAIPESDRSDVRVIDLTGRVVMPGGIDMHSHIVGPKVNSARKMQPELYIADYLEQPNHLRGNDELPPVGQTALNYLGMGYTTAMDAAISPSAARYVHHELEAFPFLDAGFFLLVGNNHYIMEAASRNDVASVKVFLKCLLQRCRGFAPKVVNPGGVENWKAGRTGTTKDLSMSVDGFNTTPRQILQTLAAAANELALPHPLHVHCNNLGVPGNWETTLETMRSLNGLRAHLTHIQFHSYGSGAADEMVSQVDPLVDYINSSPELSVDVGQVLFGKTTSMTGDGPLGYFLSQVSGKKWFSHDTEIESGCGVSPIEYRNKNRIHALQWAIGLEWYLKVRNPWQVVMSTDHPNGASFMAYPEIIYLLMNANFRREKLARLPAGVLESTGLAGIEREYSLSEIAIITRAGPAKLLGLNNKGHLGVGADADLTIYSPQSNIQEMFQTPWMVIKGGSVVVHDHELKSPILGRTHFVSGQVDAEAEHRIANWFNENYSFEYQRFGISRTTDCFSRGLESIIVD